jgi:hypothetical protein
MSQKNVFPTGSSVLDRYVISTRGTAQFGDNSNNYLVGVAPTTYNTYQVATVGNINNFGLTPQNNTGSSTGTYYSNSVSAMRIPADSSANRPPTGYPGYIRYNTDSSLIEYWSGVSNSWQFVSQQPPTITTVTPTYVSDVSEITDVTAPGADLNASNVINITGTNFVATPTITFIDSAGLRTSSGNVLYQSSTNLITTFPIALLTVSAEILGPYSLLLTNVSSNLSAIKTNCITVNLQPYWVPGNSITQRSNIPVTGTYTSPITGSTTQYDGGTVLSNSASAKCTAVDPEGTTVTYTLTNDTSSNLINSGLTFQSTGYLNGTVAKLSAASSFNFSVDAYDASGVHTSIGYFILQINRYSPLIAFSSLSGLSVTTGYVDSNGLNYRTTAPYNTTPPGYTIYLIQCSTTSSGGTTGTGTITYPSVCPSYLTYIIVGGGGGGGGNQAGSGGGAGGLLMNSLFSITANGTASIQVGAGGTRAPEPSINSGGANGGTGANSFLGSNIAYGGAGGRTMDTTTATTIVNGVSGGNGCGASSWQAYGILATGGAGTNSLTLSSQGNYGGNANNINGTSGHTSGGGGGYAGPGTNDVPRPVGGISNTSFTIMNSGNGGNGLTTNLSGSQLIVAGGGGGGCYYGTAGNGGVGGGGAGISNTSTAGSAGSPATDRNGAANTGGGGGGGGLSAGTYSGYGGTGIMILRHVSYITTPTLNTYTITYGTGTNTVQTIYLTNAGAVTGSAQTNGYTVLVFTSDGTTYPSCSFTFTPTTSIGPNVSYLLCGAGGSGGQGNGGGAGGGGGGGVLIGSHYPVTINTTYNIYVGVGGRAISGSGPGNNTGTNQQGGNSTFNTITAYGGGGSGSGTGNGASGGPSPGGCGGGGGEWPNLYGASGTIGQGYEGGTTVGVGQAAGGGGAGGPGGYSTSSVVGAGGDGIPSFITGTLAYYGGGGGASGNNLAGSLGGLCGATSPYNQGGHGGTGAGTGASGTPTSGTQYYGGGGGGTYQVGAGTLIGGSGTVILRFPSYTMS